MKQVHMILQGKGGVGKSYVASLLAQHYDQQGVAPICIDTDPVNATLAGYKAFGARTLELLKGDDLDPRAFDQLVDQVMSASDDTTFIIDNGAATFVPLCAYLAENQVVPFLSNGNVSVKLHSVVTGGQAVRDTISGLAALLKNFNVPVVVWLNEFFGLPQWNGVTFEQSPLYQDNIDKIHALIQIPALRRETFGYDLEQVMKAKRTFAEAIADEGLSLMARQRLSMVWRDLDQRITAARL
jgi:hypothetical protein